MKNVKGHARDAIRSEAWGHIRHHVGYWACDEIEMQIDGPSWDQIRSMVWSQIGTQVELRMRGQIG